MKNLKFMMFFVGVFLCLEATATGTGKNAHIFATATFDSSFKYLLADQEVVKNIVNAIVPDFAGDNKVTELSPIFGGIPELPINNQRQLFMDFAATTSTNQRIVIKIQAKRHIMFDERALFYAAYTYSHQLDGQKILEQDCFKRINKIYAINFLDFDSEAALWSTANKGVDTLMKRNEDHPMAAEQYIKHYVMTDKKSGQEIQSLQLIQVELPRALRILKLDPNIALKEIKEKEFDFRWWWLSVIKCSDKYTQEFYEKAPTEVQKGLERLRFQRWGENLQSEYKKELDASNIYSADIADRVAAGIKEKLEENRIEFKHKILLAAFKSYNKNKIPAMINELLEANDIEKYYFESFLRRKYPKENKKIKDFMILLSSLVKK